MSLEVPTYDALMKTVQRDCRVLESFRIMDYSLLVGVHNLDLAARDRVRVPSLSNCFHRFTKQSSFSHSSTFKILQNDAKENTGNKCFFSFSPFLDKCSLIHYAFRYEYDKNICTSSLSQEGEDGRPSTSTSANDRWRAVQNRINPQKKKLVAHSTAMEAIQAETEPIDEEEHLP